MSSGNDFTLQDVKRILSYIREGASQTAATQLIGREKKSFINFKRCADPVDGMDEDFAVPLTGDDRRCNNCRGCIIHNEVLRQEQLFKMEAMRDIKDATFMGKPDWKAKAWLLERKFPDEFAETQKQELTASLNVAVNNARTVVEAIKSAITQPVGQSNSISRHLLEQAEIS